MQTSKVYVGRDALVTIGDDSLNVYPARNFSVSASRQDVVDTDYIGHEDSSDSIDYNKVYKKRLGGVYEAEAEISGVYHLSVPPMIGRTYPGEMISDLRLYVRASKPVPDPSKDPHWHFPIAFVEEYTQEVEYRDLVQYRIKITSNGVYYPPKKQ